jgi:hypothetical protein
MIVSAAKSSAMTCVAVLVDQSWQQQQADGEGGRQTFKKAEKRQTHA